MMYSTGSLPLVVVHSLIAHLYSHGGTCRNGILVQCMIVAHVPCKSCPSLKSRTRFLVII